MNLHPDKFIVGASQVVLAVKNLPDNAGDTREVGLIPDAGRPPGVGNGAALQYSCPENSEDRGDQQATVYGATESDSTEHTHTHTGSYRNF